MMLNVTELKTVDLLRYLGKFNSSTDNAVSDRYVYSRHLAVVCMKQK